MLLAAPLPHLSAQATGLEPAFVENRGQWPSHLKYGSRQKGITSWFTKDGVHLLLEQLPKGWDTDQIRHKSGLEYRQEESHHEESEKEESSRLEGHALFLRPLRSSRHSLLQATGAFLGLRHEIKTKRVLDIQRREGLRYQDIWPGVDLRFAHISGLLAYELDISPGADLRRIAFALEGAERLWIGEQGQLFAATSLGALVQSRPRAFVSDGGDGERELPVRFVLLGEGLGSVRYGFEVEDWKGKQALRIDPGISWAGYVGGTAYDGFNAVCNVIQGNLVAVGFSYSLNFPVSLGAYQTTIKGFSDVVVVKRTAQGQRLLWATYIGGRHRESAYMVDSDAKGQVVFGGWTSSHDFPVSSKALQKKHGGGSTDAFLSKLDAAGRKLVFSTYLGGNMGDVLYGLEEDSRGRVYLCGETNSPNFPLTAKSFGRLATGKLDAFVSQTDALGASLLFSGRIGGRSNDGATNLRLDEKRKRLFVCGATSSSDFPTSSLAYDKIYSGGRWIGDAFVISLPLSGTAVLASSFLGGSADDEAWGIDVDPEGNPVLAGGTQSKDYPTTKGVIMPRALGLGDAFVTRLSPILNTVLMSTFFGGGLTDGALGVDVEPDGNIRVSGSTWSNGFLFSMPFPTTAGAYSRKHAGGEDAFVFRLDENGRLPLYSSLYGGSGNEWFYTDAGASSSLMPVAGFSFSSNFPVSQRGRKYSGKGDGLMGLVDLLPKGTSLGGTATATCAGEPTLLPAFWPKAGTPNYLLLASGAPRRRPGILLVGTASSRPLKYLGAGIWMNLALPAFVMPLSSDLRGKALIRFPLPPRQGLIASVQLFWLEQASCARPLSATKYLRLVLQ